MGTHGRQHKAMAHMYFYETEHDAVEQKSVQGQIQLVQSDMA